MDNKKEIDIPFGAFDSKLYYQEINIPDGFETTIKDNKIILKRKESEDEKIKKEIIDYLLTTDDKELIPYESWIAWLEKQGEQKPADTVEPKFKVGDTIYYDSFGEVKSMIVANVVTDSTDNPMYEDKEGNAVFEKDLIEQNSAWSKEDEKIVNDLLWIIEAYRKNSFNETHKYMADKSEKWLKSIKGRV